MSKPTYPNDWPAMRSAIYDAVRSVLDSSVELEWSDQEIAQSSPPVVLMTERGVIQESLTEPVLVGVRVQVTDSVESEDVTISLGDDDYTYTVQMGDDVAAIRNALLALVQVDYPNATAHLTSFIDVDWTEGLFSSEGSITAYLKRRRRYQGSITIQFDCRGHGQQGRFQTAVYASQIDAGLMIEDSSDNLVSAGLRYGFKVSGDNYIPEIFADGKDHRMVSEHRFGLEVSFDDITYFVDSGVVSAIPSP